MTGRYACVEVAFRALFLSPAEDNEEGDNDKRGAELASLPILGEAFMVISRRNSIEIRILAFMNNVSRTCYVSGFLRSVPATLQRAADESNNFVRLRILHKQATELLKEPIFRFLISFV